MSISLPLHFQFSYFPLDAQSVDHLPGENLHKTNAIEAADKECGIHYLGFCLVGFKEFGAAISGRDNEDDGPYPDKNYDGKHFSAVEIPCHRPY
jgi:hypothetical protein